MCVCVRERERRRERRREEMVKSYSYITTKTPHRPYLDKMREEGESKKGPTRKNVNFAKNINKKMLKYIQEICVEAE